MEASIIKNYSSMAKRKIKTPTLGKNTYTLSLLQEGLRLGLLTREEFSSIQMNIMTILKQVILRYTKGNSTSVTTDKAEALLLSILYSIDFYNSTFEEPEDALTNLKSKDIKEIYESGIKLVTSCVEETKDLYNDIVKNKLQVQVEAYNITVDEGIAPFFDKYSVLFAAQDTLGSIDYPLVFDDMSIRGVLYIKKYLEHLDIENKFCRYFSMEVIDSILKDFGRTCGFDYRIELINIFQVVINNAIFLAILNENIKNLTISKYQYELLIKKLNEANESQLELLIDKGIDRIIRALTIEDTSLIAYIKAYKSDFLFRILNTMENESLNKMVIIHEEGKERVNKIKLKDTERLSNKEFNLLIKNLMNCNQAKDKIEIIYSNIHGIQDFIDILNGDCLFGEEFRLLFDSLGYVELAILSKIVLYEELREDDFKITNINFRKIQKEIQWQECFVEFVQGLDKGKLELVEELIREVDYEEISFY